MRGSHRRLLPIAAAAVTAAIIIIAGCSTSVHSGLPNHIKTVEVHIFQNKTMYKSIEAWITRDLVDRVNGDPTLTATSRNGDALITGEILGVKRETLRETTTNEPGTVRITVEASFSFYDNVNRRYIIEDQMVRSSHTGLSVGIYEASRGGTPEEGERSAAKALAAEIARRTIGMW